MMQMARRMGNGDVMAGMTRMMEMMSRMGGMMGGQGGPAPPQPKPQPPMMSGGVPWMGGMWGMMLVSFIFWALVAAAAAVLIWWLVTRRPGRGRDAALDVLRERYARGEITREEFESRRRDLAA